MSRSPSAPLLLGVTAGLVAAVAILPTALPLGWQIDTAEREFTAQSTERALSASARVLLREQQLPGVASTLGADVLWISEPDKPAIAEGVPASILEQEGDCDGIARLQSSGSDIWSMACLELEDGRTLHAAVRHEPRLATNIGVLIAALALIVGIITSLGVLRILSPLSNISVALERVRVGERGVRVRPAGLAELDALIDDLNAAASAMEDREDAIRGRIAVVHELARIVAHEVRNPLQSMELLTSLIAAEPNIEERRQLMHAIQTEIRNLDGVVTRLLREGIDQQGFRLLRADRPLAPMLEQVITLRRPEAHRRGVIIEGQLNQNLHASVDSALFARSMENLVSNALQAVADGKGRVRITLEGNDEQIEVRVDDNGPGVSAELAKTVFDPHITGRPDGHGLGLSMVREVLRAHGGTIHHEPSLMGGACFVARIPTDESAA
jgi:signal transduction histidine kinase